MKNQEEPRAWLTVRPLEEQIDNLIEAGWHVLDTDFDRAAFINWRQRAFECLRTLLGPDHPYTACFRAFVVHEEKSDLLAGTGILVAAKHKPHIQPREAETASHSKGLAIH